MRITLTILLSLLMLLASAQAPTERYFNLTGTDGWNNKVLAYIPSDSAANQTKRDAIFFFPGSGEQGGADNTLAKAKLYGPGNFISSGAWDGSVVVNGITQYPYVFICQLESESSGSDHTEGVVKSILNKYGTRLDTMRLYGTGLSLGAQMCFGTAATAVDARRMFAAMWPLSSGTAIGTGLTPSHFSRYANAGGKVLYMIGESDNPAITFSVSEVLTPMNAAVLGSAIGRTWDAAEAGTAGHGGWNTFYDPTKDIDVAGTISGYEWMMQYDKYPHASAQTTINITAPTSSVTLNGVTSSWYKNIAWSKISGTGTITSASSDTTTVTGISSTSVFRLTVTNTASGDVDTHDVTVNYSGGTTEYFEIRRKKLNRLKILEN